MNKIAFGVRVPNSGPLSSIDNIVKATKTAESMGFDAVWVHDHVVWSSEMHRHHISSGAAEALTDTQDANFFEATTILSYLAAETKKIVLGVACLVMPCRNPIYAAKQYSTLDIFRPELHLLRQAIHGRIDDLQLEMLHAVLDEFINAAAHVINRTEDMSVKGELHAVDVALVAFAAGF